MYLNQVDGELARKINDLVANTYQKTFSEKEQMLQQAFDLIPEPATQWAHPTTMVALGFAELYFGEGRYDDAEKWADIAVQVAEIGTTNAGTYVFAGIVSYEKQDFDKAYRYFDKAYEEIGYSGFAVEDKKYWNFYKTKKEELKTTN